MIEISHVSPWVFGGIVLNAPLSILFILSDPDRKLNLGSIEISTEMTADLCKLRVFELKF
jgi:hypothetical protein